MTKEIKKEVISYLEGEKKFKKKELEKIHSYLKLIYEGLKEKGFLIVHEG